MKHIAASHNQNTAVYCDETSLAIYYGWLKHPATRNYQVWATTDGGQTFSWIDAYGEVAHAELACEQLRQVRTGQLAPDRAQTEALFKGIPELALAEVPAQGI